jgi:hypothetical protein
MIILSYKQITNVYFEKIKVFQTKYVIKWFFANLN